MKVILREDVPKLGRGGEVVEVREGFGRNYLLPQGLAVRADEKNLRRLEHERRAIAVRQAKRRGDASALGEQLGQTPLRIARRVGEQQKLYGSVTGQDIAEALLAIGLRVDRRQIRLEEPIKTTGDFEVEVRLHPEVSAKVKLSVVAE